MSSGTLAPGSLAPVWGGEPKCGGGEGGRGVVLANDFIRYLLTDELFTDSDAYLINKLVIYFPTYQFYNYLT